MHYVDIDLSDRKKIKPGMKVEISEKGSTIRGVIQEILTKQPSQSALKVRLTNGKEGRLLGVLSKVDLEREEFQFYNLLLNHSNICALFVRKENQCYATRKEIQGHVYLTVYLFDDARKAKELLKGSKFDHKDYYIRPLSRIDLITVLYPYDFYVINLKHRISFAALQQYEEKFKTPS